MKRIWLSGLVVLLAGAAWAQEITPPRFNGSGDIDFFIRRLAVLAERIAVEERIPADSLSLRIGIGLRIGEDGSVSDWRMIDNTRTGRDSCAVPPATEATLRLVRAAFDRMEGDWSPAERDGRPVGYRMRWTIRIPIEKIARAQDADPLLFLGQDPAKSLHDWVRVRVRHDGRFAGKEGLTRVRFHVEADGRITIDEVLETPDERQAKEVVRVIRNSRGNWTPRKVRGVPQRTEYVYGINLVDGVVD